MHQLELALRFADRIVGLADAHVVFDGTTAELDDFYLARIYGGQGLVRKVDDNAEVPYLPPLLKPKMEMSL
jgi:phosphonate transport system ATP-binding protein